MAQTDIETLEGLPVCKAGATQQQAVVNLVDKILTITKDEDYPANPAKQASVKELEHAIDQMVYELYGLGEEEKALVEAFTKSKGN